MNIAFDLQRFSGTFVPDEGTEIITISGKIIKPAGNVMSGNTMTFKMKKKNTLQGVTLPSSAGRTTPINMLGDNRTLQNISDIFNSGRGPSCFIPGDYFDITFQSDVTLSSGTIAANSTWRVVCLGIDHNSSLEGTNRGHFCIGKNTDGTEIAFCYEKMNPSNTNSGGWASCSMKTWLNGTFYDALPTDLKNVITECTKYTDNTGNVSDIADNVTSTSQKIWLLAEFEVFGSRTYYANQYEKSKQTQYDYYKNGNSTIRYGHSNGKNMYWWLRSPNHNKSIGFCNVTGNDGVADANAAASVNGVVPCFTIGGN